MKIINAVNLVKIYEDKGVPVRALSNVSLTINKGDFISIAGPSGSGKTTLLNIIGGLDAPTKGRVYLEGEDLTKMSASQLARLRLNKYGFIFQSYNLIPVLTALENVEYVMHLQGIPSQERHRRATEILDEVGLRGMYNRRPDHLSGGEQQRVAVARAVVAMPMLVLADEPTANLDSTTGGKLMDLMSHLNQNRGITFLFSTHDPTVMKRARRLIHLKDGRIVGEENGDRG